MVPSEGGTHVGSGGRVDVHIAVASTWSWGCRCAAAMGPGLGEHVHACVVAPVGAKTSVKAHTLQCHFPGTRDVASLGLGWEKKYF